MGLSDYNFCLKIINKVYLDGPCDFLIRTHFFVIREYPGLIVLQSFPIEPVYKSESMDYLFRASKTPANVLEPHSPSMYNLSMLKYFILAAMSNHIPVPGHVTLLIYQ